MNSKTPIRILFCESETALSVTVNKALHTKSALRLFQVKIVPHLSEAFHELDQTHIDLILVEDATDLERLHAHAPKTAIVALLPDADHQAAPTVVEKGAQEYFFESQIQDENFPAFLFRAAERASAQKQIRENEERFRLMIENASDVILILDGQGVVSYASPSTEHILSHAPTQLTGRNALDFIHRDDRLRFLDDFEQAFKNGDRLAFVQFRFRRPDEGWVHMEGRGRIVPDRSGQRVCILNSHDVSHRVKLEEELRSLSLKDELTGLHNRRSFISFLDQHLKMQGRAKQKALFVLFIDLDEFKWINDNLGHKVGDQALIGASHVLKSTFRDADIIARLGGDEFVVFLTEGLQPVNVEALKKRLFEGLAEWNAKEQRPYQLKMSVGVVQHDPVAHKTAQDLLTHADELMYKQKKEKKLISNSARPAP